jgi:hypothetical protein
MYVVRPIFAALLVAALAAYTSDCSAMSTSDEAMQCCNSMSCPSHGHENSQDCCKTMPSLHAPFVQPCSMHGVSLSLAVFAALPGVTASQGLSSAANIFAVHCHPPPTPKAAEPTPLRI